MRGIKQRWDAGSPCSPPLELSHAALVSAHTFTLRTRRGMEREIETETERDRGTSLIRTAPPRRTLQ